MGELFCLAQHLRKNCKAGWMDSRKARVDMSEVQKQGEASGGVNEIHL